MKYNFMVIGLVFLLGLTGCVGHLSTALQTGDLLQMAVQVGRGEASLAELEEAYQESGVAASVDPDALAVAQILDGQGNSNGYLDGAELIAGIQRYASGQPLDGRAIDGRILIGLIQIYAARTPLGAPAVNDPPRITDLDISPNPALTSDYDRGIENDFDLLIYFSDPQQDVVQQLVHVVWPDGDNDDYTEPVTAQENADGVARSPGYSLNSPGTITFTVVLVDSAGNRSAPYTESFQVVEAGGGPPTDHAPVITSTNCPTEIPVGQTTTCSVGFSDADGDIVEARFVKVAGSPGSTSFDPGIYGQTSGSFSFNIECSGPTPQQTMEVTLVDEAGSQSSPAQFDYACVESGPGPRDVDTAFLALINQYRSQSGQCWDIMSNVWVSWPAGATRDLTLSSELTDASIYHSQFMADHDCFAHQCPGEPDLRTRIEQAGYTGWTSYGENIAAGRETPEEAFDAWRNSPGHNQNMLTCQFEEIGVGRVYAAGTQYGWYWTTDFGSR